jgi:hypothetical protein
MRLVRLVLGASVRAGAPSVLRAQRTLLARSVLLAPCLLLALAGCARDAEYYPGGLRRADGDIGSDDAATREDGTWTWWYPNGERRESGTLDHGRRVGEWTQWYPNAQRRSQGMRMFDPAAHASPREGSWTFWYENGVVLGRGLFHAGRREGHWDYSLDDGTLDGDRTGEYHDDLRLP